MPGAYEPLSIGSRTVGARMMNLIFLARFNAAGWTVVIITLGKSEYLVLWESYPNEEASWVNEEDVTSTAIRSVMNQFMFKINICT